MSDERILVVDEAASTVLKLVHQLQQEGFQPVGVTRGAQAVESYETQPFDLALVGLCTDGLSGSDVLKAIMLFDPEALVVMTGVDATVQLAVEAMKSGARDFILNPLDEPDLAARLTAVLERGAEGGVRGDLRDLPLTTIVSINCSEYNQAELLVRRRGQAGALYFEQGSVVHASLDDDEGEEAIYELLTWGEGSFVLRQSVPAPRRTVYVDWTGLLLEGMRRIDDGSEDADLDLGEEETGTWAWPDRVATALRSVRGVQGVVVSSPGGELLAEAACTDPVAGAGLTALVAQSALGVSDSLDAGAPRHASVTGSGGRFLVVPFMDEYVGLWLSERQPAESILLRVTNVMRRYRRLKGGQR